MSDPKFRPRYVSFDCYGTLIWFQMREAVVPLIADRLDDAGIERFLDLFRIYRYDQVLEYAPYADVLERAYRRTCARFDLSVSEEDVAVVTTAIDGWGPHPDVVDPLVTMAREYPLVILSNADDRHLKVSVPRLEAPFHAVLTAEQAGAYKPRYAAFEHMFDTLDAAPEDFLHVSSHQRYDLMPARDLGMVHTVFLDRGYDPSLPQYQSMVATSLDEVNAALGLGR